MAKDQCIADLSLEEVESRGEKTREVRTHNLIIAIDREKNEDHRYGLEEFVDSEIGKEEKVTRESPEVWGTKGFVPWL
jgi:hypothetical protein